MKLFRLGRNLIAGEAKNASEKTLHIEATHFLDEGVWEKISDPVIVKVLESFIVNSDFQLKEDLSEKEGSKSFHQLVHENFSPFLGRRWVEFGNTKVVSYERNEAIHYLSENEAIQTVEVANVLSNCQVGQFMALEANRDNLVSLGLVDILERGPVSDNLVELGRDIHAYMKVSPFKDITVLREGTSVAVLGYYQGCAIVEADGDLFYRPVEETAYWDKAYKDDAYYFSLDGNDDGLPDPLQALPSKPALYTNRPRREDNYNVQPDLAKAAQHFGPNQDMLDDEDFSVIESFLGTNGFEDFERLGHEELHDIDPKDEPGLEPHDHETPFDKQDTLLKRGTAIDGDGPDAVDHDYDGHYADEPTPDDGTGAQEPVQESHAVVNAVSRILKELGFEAAAADVNNTNVDKYAQWAINDAKKRDKSKARKFASGFKKLGLNVHESELELAMDLINEGADIDSVLVGEETNQRERLMKETFPLYEGEGHETRRATRT